MDVGGSTQRLVGRLTYNELSDTQHKLAHRFAECEKQMHAHCSMWGAIA